MTLCVETWTKATGAPMHKRNFLALAGTLAIGPWALAQQPVAARAGLIRVAAASDLQFALAELADRYQKESSQRVQLNMGSSGNFTQQIRQGLPVDLFMSADEEFVFQLADAGLTRDRGAIYALGRIAVLVPAGSSIALDPGLRGLGEALPVVRHFAIANPEHAPYGRAAQQALERLGLWQRLQPKLVIGENIAQATQFVTSGAAQAGITAASLAAGAASGATDAFLDVACRPARAVAAAHGAAAIRRTGGRGLLPIPADAGGANRSAALRLRPRLAAAGSQSRPWIGKLPGSRCCWPY